MANPALTKMLGYDCENELLSLDIEYDVYCNPDQRVLLMHQCMETGYLKEAEANWRRKDGRTITVLISAVPTIQESGGLEAIQGFIQDVTEPKSLARQFWKAQKMESIGRLAGGVAHDFNNILMIVGSYADLILQSEVADKNVARYAAQIHQTATKAVSVTRQLLAFSRQQLLEPEILDLNTVVAELGKILPKLMREDVAVVTMLEPVLHRVRVDRGQMEQVIMNLAVNARDAMPIGGSFEICTQNVELDAAHAAQCPPMNPGFYVKLSVVDTGVGMDSDVLSHLFEPFFTTKGRGAGTGLGLATVYGIVKQNSGFIWVTSEVGHGTTFDVYLPQVHDPATRALSPSASVANLRGSESILLVEDEAALRSAICESLTLRGYTVLVAGDGAEAMRICEQHADTIDLVLTDLVLPGMDGIEVSKAVSSRFPGIHTLFISGYADRAADRLDTKGMLLRKPLSLSDLASKLRAVFDTPSLNSQPALKPDMGTLEASGPVIRER
jgi:PAS domain S-box-containing protein